jgi:hypothetical protein
MAGLHGGDDAELLEARDVGRIDDLGVLDAVAWWEAGQNWIAR